MKMKAFKVTVRVGTTVKVGLQHAEDFAELAVALTNGNYQIVALEELDRKDIIHNLPVFTWERSVYNKRGTLVSMIGGAK
jgi:hypothetical protein